MRVGLVVVFLLLASLCAGSVRSEPFLIWNKTYGGELHGESTSVVPSGDGGFLVAGHTNSARTRYDDVHLMKVDAEGNRVWEGTYGTGKNDYAQAVVQSLDGGFVIAGYANCPLGAGTTGSCDIYLLKIDARGETIWERIYGGDRYEWANCIAQSGDGGFIVGGSISGDAYVLKIDSQGNKIWERTYGASRDDRIYAIADSGDGGFILTGFGNNEQDVYVLRIDSEGDTLWEKTYGGPDRDYGWAITRGSEGFVVAGSTYSKPFWDIHLLGLGNNGDQIWERTHSTTIGLTGRAIVQSGDGYLVVGGLGERAYVLMIDTEGEKMWETTLPYSSEATGVTEAGDGGFIILGSDFYVGKIKGTPFPVPEHILRAIWSMTFLTALVGCWRKIRSQKRMGTRLPQ